MSLLSLTVNELDSTASIENKKLSIYGQKIIDY